MAAPSIRESQLSGRPWMAGRRLPVWSGRNRGLGEMTTNYQAAPGYKLFGIGVLNFVNGLVWFDYSRSPGIFTLRPLNMFDAFFRAEIVIPKLCIDSDCGVGVMGFWCRDFFAVSAR